MNNSPACKVLVVDDSPIFRQVAKEILAGAFPGIDIQEAEDGTEALKILNSHPRLMITDIRLPGMNGLELAKIVKKRYPGVAVIIVTNHDTPEYREAAEDLGADAFISKGSALGTEVIRAVLTECSDLCAL